MLRARFCCRMIGSTTKIRSRGLRGFLTAHPEFTTLVHGEEQMAKVTHWDQDSVQANPRSGRSDRARDRAQSEEKRVHRLEAFAQKLHDQDVEADKDQLHRPKGPRRSVVPIQGGHTEIAIGLQQVPKPQCSTHARVQLEWRPKALVLLPKLIVVFLNPVQLALKAGGQGPAGLRLEARVRRCEARDPARRCRGAEADEAPRGGGAAGAAVVLWRPEGSALLFVVPELHGQGLCGAWAAPAPQPRQRQRAQTPPRAGEAAALEERRHEHLAPRPLLEGPGVLLLLPAPHADIDAWPRRRHLVCQQLGRALVDDVARGHAEENGEHQVEDGAAQAEHVDVEHEVRAIPRHLPLHQHLSRQGQDQGCHEDVVAKLRDRGLGSIPDLLAGHAVGGDLHVLVLEVVGLPHLNVVHPRLAVVRIDPGCPTIHASNGQAGPTSHHPHHGEEHRCARREVRARPHTQARQAQL
mmetsp:Transcript_108932/g.347768  ORF Transcript_108932/g.347768 Transcript_108932/m.347768 type:complete len:466 (+) Transcript_108932:1293-2690(+)